MEVRAGVDPELLVFRSGAQVAFGIAAEVHRKPAPVAGAVHRHRDAVPARAVHAPVLGIEIVAHVCPHHVVVERVRIVAARPPEQLVRRVREPPVADEAQRENAAVIRLVAILVGATLPRHDRFERGRLQVGEAPLGTRMVRDAERADVAGAPRPLGDPLHRVVEVDALLVRARFGPSGRSARAAAVDAHARITARTPPQRIHRLPVHVRIGFFLEVRRRHPQLVFLVDADVRDHRHLFRRVRAEHVRVKHRTVPHRDLHVLFDDEFVLLRLGNVGRLLGRLVSCGHVFLSGEMTNGPPAAASRPAEGKKTPTSVRPLSPWEYVRAARCVRRPRAVRAVPAR